MLLRITSVSVNARSCFSSTSNISLLRFISFHFITVVSFILRELRFLVMQNTMNKHSYVLSLRRALMFRRNFHPSEIYEPGSEVCLLVSCPLRSLVNHVRKVNFISLLSPFFLPLWWHRRKWEIGIESRKRMEFLFKFAYEFSGNANKRNFITRTNFYLWVVKNGKMEMLSAFLIKSLLRFRWVENKWF